MWTPTIYILGSGVIFQNALEGLQQVFDPTYGSTPWSSSGGGFGNIGVLIQLAILVGILALAGKNLMTQRGEWHHIIVAVAIYAGLFVPTTSVLVQNLYNGDTRPVNGVPIGIAYPAGLISQISYQMMKVVDQVNSNPIGSSSPIDLAQGGFAEPLQTFFALRSIPMSFVKSNPDLSYTFLYFVKNCNVNSTGFGEGSSIDNSNNVLSSLENSNNFKAAGNTVEYSSSYPYGGNGFNVTCTEAAADVANGFAAYNTGALTATFTAGQVPIVPMDQLLGQAMGTPGGVDTAQGGNAQVNVAADGLDSVMPQCTTNGSGAAMGCIASNEGLAFMANQLAGCLATAGASLANNPGATTLHAGLPSYCTTMAPGIAAQEANNAGAASAFEANVVPMMTILQFLFFALAPLVAVVIAFMGAQGAGIYMKYVMFGIWTQSWLPVVAIINDYAQYISQGSFTNMISALSPGSTNPALLTHFALMPQVFSTAQLALSNANMMVSMTPILTLAILTGSFMALTQMGKMMGSESTMSSKETTPQMGATTFNSAVTGNANTSDGAGFISAENAGTITAPAMNYAETQSRGLTAATSKLTSSAVSASSAVNQMASAATGYDQTNGTGQNLVKQDGEKLDHMLKAGHDVSASVAHAYGITQSQALQIMESAAASGGPGALGVALKAQEKKDGTQGISKDKKTAFQSASSWVTGTHEALTSLQSTVGSLTDSSAQTSGLKQAFQQGKQKADAFGEQASAVDNLAQSAQQASSEGLTQPMTTTDLLNKGNSTFKAAPFAGRMNNFSKFLEQADPSLQQRAEKLVGQGAQSTAGQIAVGTYAMKLAAASGNDELAAVIGQHLATATGIGGGGVTNPVQAQEQQVGQAVTTGTAKLEQQATSSGATPPGAIHENPTVGTGPTSAQATTTAENAGHVVNPSPAVAQAKAQYKNDFNHSSDAEGAKSHEAAISLQAKNASLGINPDKLNEPGLMGELVGDIYKHPAGTVGVGVLTSGFGDLATGVLGSKPLVAAGKALKNRFSKTPEDSEVGATEPPTNNAMNGGKTNFGAAKPPPLSPGSGDSTVSKPLSLEQRTIAEILPGIEGNDNPVIGAVETAVNVVKEIPKP
jgi:conjugal transfer mating pair stabilization protein TraG